MRCDDCCPRCGELEKSVTHVIFECPPALQVWSLASTPTSPDIFPVPSLYANMDYLFWRKNNIIEPELDRDPYPWIIWYIWKARNDKLFRGIDLDPLELVRHAESECQAWFTANETIPSSLQQHSMVDSQVLTLGNICLIDGSWTPTSRFSGCRWVWMDRVEITTYGNTELYKERIYPPLRIGGIVMGMENMLQHSNCQNFGTYCKDLIALIKEPHAWPNFSTELERIETLKICFLEFKISYVPRNQNRISDSLARTARSLHRELYFVGCYIPVSLPRPPLT